MSEMVFILLVLLGGPRVHTQEFTSEFNCNTARMALVSGYKGDERGLKAWCVPK